MDKCKTKKKMNYALIFGLFSSNFLMLLELCSGRQGSVAVPDVTKLMESTGMKYTPYFQERETDIPRLQEIWEKHQTESFDDLKAKLDSHYSKSTQTTGIDDYSNYEPQSPDPSYWSLRSPGWKQLQDFMGK